MKNELKQLGLSENEVDAYLKLLSSGEVPVSVLAYKMKLPRNTCRYVCHQLMDKKLVSTRKDGNTFLFRAENPDKLLYLIEQKRKDLQESEEGINRILADLDAIRNPKTVLPKVRYYEGKEGLRRSYMEMLDDCEGKKMMAIFTVVEEVGVDLQKFFTDIYVPKRKEKGIFMRNLCLKSPKTIAYRERDKEELRETRFILDDNFPALNTEINLFDDYMHYMSFDENASFAMIVKDKYITQMLKGFFEIMWKMNGSLED